MKILRPASKRGLGLVKHREAYRENLAIALPSIAEGSLSMLMSSVDTIMVSALGPAAIAAVGLTSQPRMLLLTPVMSLGVAVTAITARRFGEGDRDGANACLRRGVTIAAVLAALMSAAGALAARPIMFLAGAMPDTLELSAGFFRIISAGMIFSFLNMTICAAFRGIGRTKITMTTNLTANAVNLCLNYLLIEGRFGFPALGVNGSAIATVSGGATACAISLTLVLRGKGYLTLKGKSGEGLRKLFDRESVNALAAISGSSMAEQVSMRVGFFITAMLVARMGTITFASYNIVMQFTTLSFTLGDGLAVAGAALVGRSLGAKDPEKAKLHALTLQRMGFFISTGMVILTYFLRYPIAGLFIKVTDPDYGAIIKSVTDGLVVVLFAFHAQNQRTLLCGCLRGAGDVKFTAFISFVSVCFIRPITVWLFCYPLHWETGAWASFVLDQTVRAVWTQFRIKGGKWLKIKV